MVEITTSELPGLAWWRTHADLPDSSVLNLPPTASDYEIRDRYRQLSIQYHPDKQRDESTKEIASKQFLKIQKAYQGMSVFIPSNNVFSNPIGY
jgi:DnaJ-domain-containing protein 1